MLRVAGIRHEEVCRAIQMSDFKDFEDCLQDRCAKEINAQYIITPKRIVKSVLITIHRMFTNQGKTKAGDLSIKSPA